MRVLQRIIRVSYTSCVDEASWRWSTAVALGIKERLEARVLESRIQIQDTGIGCVEEVNVDIGGGFFSTWFGGLEHVPGTLLYNQRRVADDLYTRESKNVIRRKLNNQVKPRTSNVDCKNMTEYISARAS